MMSQRKEAVINFWFMEHAPIVYIMASMVPHVDTSTTAALVYQKSWDKIVPSFDDRQLSRLEAVLTTFGATIDCQGTELEYCLDFFDPQDENELQE
jgi:hypothetical protein